MQFGVQFFPDVRPEEKSAEAYFSEALDLAEEADRLGYTHIRIVEHYFHYYGGYSPNPIVFLAAAAQRTRRARLVTGAVLPAFNHPLKLAGEIAMLDALSHGRLDVGFARAFLPHEFRRFGRSPDESVARFREGIEQVDLLLSRDSVTHRGRFHTIESTTSLPRPTQLPRPKFYVAALNTPDSFEFAGRMGYSVMGIAFVAEKLRPLLDAYRTAWREAGHPGQGEVMLAFHLYCEPDGARARAFAAPFLDRYLASLAEAASDWLDGRTSKDYPGYDKVIAALRASNAKEQIASGAAWIGSPDEIAATILRMQDDFGGFEHASLQVNFNAMPFAPALASMRLFAREVSAALHRRRELRGPQARSGAMGFYDHFILPRLLDLVMRNRQLDGYRQRAIATARGLVLEIGVGSGLNLALYGPAVDRVCAIDPAPELLRLASPRAVDALVPVSLVRATGEHLPFADAIFDTVVTTWTLCSIADPVAALIETRRVLKPAGFLVFVEHGLSPEPGVVRWQRGLTPCWRHIGGGCHLDRKMDDLVRAAGFRLDAIETGYMRGPKPWTFMYQGRANRRSG